MAYESNLEKSISTVASRKKAVICRLKAHHYVRYELASVIIDNSGIGGDL